MAKDRGSGWVDVSGSTNTGFDGTNLCSVSHGLSASCRLFNLTMMAVTIRSESHHGSGVSQTRGVEVRSPESYGPSRHIAL